MDINNKDLTYTINGVVYSAPVISRVEKILNLVKSVIETGGSGGGGGEIDLNNLTPEQMSELLALLENNNP